MCNTCYPYPVMTFNLIQINLYRKTNASFLIDAHGDTGHEKFISAFRFELLVDIQKFP